MTFEHGQILNDRYRFAALIHQSQSGGVYRAWDLYNQTACVLKEIAVQPGENAAERAGQMRSEVERLFKLDHPNLVHVFDAFSIPGQGDYLVMEYIEGNDLSVFFKHPDPNLPGGVGGGAPPTGMSEKQALPWMMQIGAALSYLHSQIPPIVHGDIKPENIKITPEGKAVLVDLGYSPQIRRGALPTPGYSAPELYGSSILDPRSDVYSLGATLYTLLTGVIPPLSVDLATGAASLVPARQINPLISTETDRLIQQSLQTNRNLRLPGISAFNAALTEAYTRLPGGTLVSGAAVTAATALGATQVARPLSAETAASTAARPPAPAAATGGVVPPAAPHEPVSLGEAGVPRRDLTQMIILAVALVAVACVILVSLWFLFSRRMGGSSANVDSTQAASTQAASTLIAQVTAYASQTAAAAAAQTAQVTLPPGTPTTLPATATDTPQAATPTRPVCEKASFVTDVTIPDNTVMTPSTAFTKTWKVRNDSGCTWDTGYSLVFAGGTLLASQNSVPFPGQVQPGGTIDLSIDMTAPATGGAYQSNWLLRSPAGNTFGVGPGADNPLFVRILVSTPVQPNPAYAYDFTARACSAQWRSATGVISCNNISSDPRGSAIALAASPLERGQENEPGLWVRPDQNSNGFILGEYPAYTIQPYDHFVTEVGCPQGLNGCDVSFQVELLADSGSLNLGVWNEIYDGKTQVIDIDLSPYAGQTVRFILRMIANGPVAQANGIWFVPSVRNQPAPAPTATSSAP